MKIVESKRKIYNPVTGSYYSLYERKSETGDKPIRGCWSWKKGQEKKGKEKKK
jgi:hypothetical protein